MTPYIWHTDNLTHALKPLNPIWHGDFIGQSHRIITDTRTINVGDIFLAIQGENFDGHAFVSQAFDKGAVLAIVNKKVDSPLPQLVVGDSKKALGLLGKYRRDCHPDLQVVAITGSSGKTTTKEMLGNILASIAPTLITKGNLNNDLGVPMMLLELCDEHKFAVLELGANHVGEIAYTTSLVSPDVACVLNIGTAHLGEFGGRDNIAKTKAEIFQGLSKNGVAVLPFGDDYFDDLQTVAHQFTDKILTFGERAERPEVALDFSKLSQAEIDELAKLDFVQVMGDVFCDDVACQSLHSDFELTVNLAIDELDSTFVRLPLIGEHNVGNALAAAAMAIALGVSLEQIKSGLENTKPPKGRLTRMAFSEHTLIDDTYNANPEAILAAGKVLANESGQKILVLGDIGELGEMADSEHGKLGAKLATLEIDKILSVGTHMAQMAKHANAIRADLAQHFDNKADLLIALKNQLATPSTVLFKGSRSATMETVLADLCQTVEKS